MRGLTAISIALSALVLAPSAAAQPATSDAPLANTQLADPSAEATASALMETLRCLTCQSQSIADSDAAMAGDMRHLVRTRIAAGETPDQVRGWLVTRYGDYVTYDPQVSRTTWPLYAIPFVLLVLIALVLVRRLGKRASGPGPGPAERSQ